MENSLSLAFGSTAFPAAQGRWILRSKRRRELKKKVALLGIVNPSVGFADSSPAGEPFGRHKPKAVPMKWGKWIRTNVSGRKGNGSEMPSIARCSPSVCSLSLTDSSPAGGGAFLLRLTNSHVKPALKGEVDMSVSEWTEGLHRSCCCLR